MSAVLPPRIPQYGSPEWTTLADDDPRKVRAMVIAAECWRRYWEPDQVAARLADDLADADRLVLDRVRHASWDVAAAASWRRIVDQPTAAELAHRRAELSDQPCGLRSCRGCSRCIRAASVARRGGDYPGRPARPSTGHAA